eukprot:CAMPEP_0206380164 /NCGR_PEP_ID=MMETSP0294-20121207/11852_1 /ASSEMBLY_ACC=CAM_ASM_000327 /TAXON_ID=39354 /ORGANISM="Heterosigma akashiwo, Strain CCMP2393" /LENGTH=349 /DNA_ID=CAMNT_0053829303 /DNA_START=630 /DNA_END=1675 /DNA_ORIENTATION=-
MGTALLYAQDLHTSIVTPAAGIVQLDGTHQQNLLKNTHLFHRIGENIVYLGRQCLPTRGHTEVRGNLHQLMVKDAKHDEVLQEFQSKSDGEFFPYTSHETIEELVQLIAEQIQEKYLVEMRASPYFTIMGDECADVSKKDQVCVGVKYLHGFLDVTLIHRQSSKRTQLLADTIDAEDEEELEDIGAGRSLITFCSSRWLARSASLQRIKTVFKPLIEHLHILATVEKDGGASLAHSRMHDFDFVVNLCFLTPVFQWLEDVSRTLQGIQIEMHRVPTAVKGASDKLEKLRNNVNGAWDALYEDALSLARKVGIGESLPKSVFDEQEQVVQEGAAPGQEGRAQDAAQGLLN